MDTLGSAGLDRRAVARRAGLVAPLVALASVLLATLLDPSFTWTGSALSHTGELPPGRSVSLGLFVDRPSFLVFNGGLVTAGLVGLPFAWLLYADATHSMERSGALSFGLALASMVAAGVFYLPQGYHAVAAVVHFIATVAFLLVYGVGAVQGGRVQFGGATVLLGGAVLGIWLVWDQVFPGLGIAIPEFASALAIGGWTLVAAARKLDAHERSTLLARLGEDS